MRLDYKTFALVKEILEVTGVFFLIYMIGYATFLFISVVSGAIRLYTRRRQTQLKNILSLNYHVPVSIIVPAYNEEITVVDTVKSLLSLDYRDYEIIVVDDGSKDNTSQELIRAFDLKPIRRPVHRKIPCQPEQAVYESYEHKVPVILVRKLNGGKADALNMGINISRYPYFICMDADSILQYDSLSKIVAPTLEYDNVIAVGGVVRPSNNVVLKDGRVIRYQLPKNILACMQLMEYDRTFLAARILFDGFNGSMIISGAFGMFRKDVVIACGGYETRTVGEDMELVVRLHEFCGSNNIPYKICYAIDAVCWSQVPESLRDLCKQRKRWHVGLFQSMNSHRDIFMNKKFGLLSFVSYLYFLFYELLSPFIEVFGVFTMILSALLGLINYKFMIEFFLVYAVYGAIITLTAFFTRCQIIGLTISWKDALKAIGLCFFEVAILRFIMAFVRFFALFQRKKSRMNWGRIQRYRQNLIETEKEKKENAEKDETAEKRKNKLTGLCILLFLAGLFRADPAFAEVSFTEEASGPAECIYVAGNPDLHPLESYDPATGEYAGAVTELIRVISERTGLDFVYVSASSENQQERLGKNLQVEMLTAYTGPDGDWCMGQETICSFVRDGVSYEARLCFTEVIGPEELERIEDALADISGSELCGWTVSYAMVDTEQSGRNAVIALGVTFFVISAILLIITFRRYYLWKTEKEAAIWLDPLTHRGNRQYFCECFDKMVTSESRLFYYLICYEFDIEQANRWAGRMATEKLLMAVADTFPEDTKTRIICRTSGGVFSDLKESDDRKKLHDEIVKRLHAFDALAVEILGEKGTLFRASVFQTGRIACDGKTALLYAEDALKQNQKEPIVYCDEKSLRETVENTALYGQITSAFDNREFKLLVQPIIKAEDDRIFMGEVLSRWDNPVYGRLKPNRFLWMIQEMNYAREYDFYILRETCTLLAEWTKAGKGVLPLACNFTRISFSSEDFQKRFFQITDSYSFDRSKLHIEMTESALETKQSVVAENLEALKNAGFKTDLDDFGTGYTTFMNLLNYTFDVVKLDAEFVPQLKTEKGMRLVTGIANLIHTAGCNVTIEGIENEEQRNAAASCGCDYFQGFYYSRPTDPNVALRKFIGEDT